MFWEPLPSSNVLDFGVKRALFQNLCEERNETLNLSLVFGVLFAVCFR